MTFYLFIPNKLEDEPLPLFVEVIMVDADKVVAVYDNR
jgi:hypothetical protein